MRLKDKIAVVFGAGQSPGATPAIGNGRATSILFAREGAKVLCVDRDPDSAEATAAMIRDEGGEAAVAEADVTSEDAVRRAVEACMERWGRIDILHNNVGISVEGGDAEITEITTEAFDRIVAVNLRSMV
ncbi:MAG: SDR family NAD(P)-dependent oxidoreductase, partial [Proteobacteria bacterium]|nr:SDR family NAD(P)-dependent oxidoreductase [Pseudomonadota bacterium]